MSRDNRVRVVEVGPRDGLQNEPYTIPTAVKLELIHRLNETGVKTIEATSFVSDRAIPQLADAEAVFDGLQRKQGIHYPALVPNERGYDRARAVGIDEIALFTAASEAFNQRNINCGIEESLRRFAPVLRRAREDGVRVRGYVSTVLGCPYQGEVPIADVVRVSEALFEAGCAEISLGDTIGVGTPFKARQMFKAVAESIPVDALAVHFHDTYGQALANILTCMERGVRVVDSAVAGLGGCPYARGATGNVATEDVVYMLEGMGMEHGIDLVAMAQVGDWIAGELGRPRSRTGQAILKRN
ncbi:MAG: hydroxymethylglutaryl-CoA lyase [Wenzhouxiangella sp.]|nr:hydroxymethylglutaryl-CoA lyase [Wenzhouxiangella sp.]MCH8476647.1 hydroxymethylglutaryl-CoA lyase [Wenzhouxiangella sp.]